MTGKLAGKRIGALVIGALLCCAMVLVFSGCSSETYQPKEKTPSVSTPVVGKEGVLRVGVDANSSPFAGTTSSSGIVGINVDIAAAIADELGLKLEIVDYGSDPAKALSSGNVDIVMGVDESNSTYNFWSSDAYIESAVALFSTDSSAKIPSDSTSKIAAQTSSMSAWEVNKQFGEESLVSSESLKAAFADLDSGTVDYVAADAVIGSFAANQDGIEVSLVGLLQKPSGYAIGVSDDNSDLKQAISDTLAKMSENGVIELIEKKWLGAHIDLSKVELSKTAKAAVSASAATDGAATEETSTEAAATPEGEASANQQAAASEGGNSESTTESSADNNAATE